MKPIFLIGFMCSGKTTLGRALAHKLNIQFIDLDHRIEDMVGMSVKAIFAERGEEGFRRLERQTLSEVAAMSDVIVACGGGTPCQPGAMDLMNASGMTVRLVPDERRLIKRLMAGRHKRPLIADISSPSEMRDFLIFTNAKREPYYSKAKHKFDSSMLENNDEVSATVDRFINELVNNPE